MKKRGVVFVAGDPLQSSAFFDYSIRRKMSVIIRQIMVMEAA